MMLSSLADMRPTTCCLASGRFNNGSWLQLPRQLVEHGGERCVWQQSTHTHVRNTTMTHTGVRFGWEGGGVARHASVTLKDKLACEYNFIKLIERQVVFDASGKFLNNSKLSRQPKWFRLRAISLSQTELCYCKRNAAKPQHDLNSSDRWIV